MKRIVKLLTVTLLFTNITVISVCQTNSPNLTDQVFGRFWNEVMRYPQEKLYLQTDKPYYSAGEDIWFKGYLLNAVTHIPTTFSNFIYVELIDKTDSVFQRVKIRKDSLGFAGKMNLPSTLPHGYYTLRGYSYWMRNAGEDFFFKKMVYIGNPIDNSVNSTISYSKPRNGVVTATIRFTDSGKMPIVAKKVVCTINWTGKRKLKTSGTTNNDGIVSFPIQIESSTFKKNALDVAFADPQSKYCQKFIIPSFTEDFDVQFFPEGGTLLANCMQNIAFKAIGSNGLSVEVTGNIVDSLGEEFFQFHSTHKGMGTFFLSAQPNKTYYANVRTSNGFEKKFRLDSASTSGISLQLRNHRGKIFYQVVNKTTIEDQSLYLLVHCRGNVILVKQLDSILLSGQISESSLPAGIVSFSVINQLTGQTLSERLTFIKQPTASNIIMTTDKPTYNRREEVNLKLRLTGKDSIPVSGDFSLSITDSHSVIQDTLADNIMTNLLLTSDLKGYIEDPGAYFCDNKNETREKLDLLLLTQGWKRFNTADIVSGKKMPIQYYLEVGQALSGKVVNVFNKPSKNAEIIMLAPSIAHTSFVTTDSLGQYLISNISFPDSTSILLKAKKKKNFGDVEIIPDLDNFPSGATFTPLTEENTTTDLTDYFSQSREKYYVEGGMPVVNLAEVTVTAQKNKTSSDNSFSNMADTNIGMDKLDKMPNMSLLNLLMTIPGVQVMGDKISIRGSATPPLILIDNFETEDVTELTYLTSSDVENISVFKGPSAAVFGMRGGNGVIVVTLRKSMTSKTSKPISLACIYPLGYQKPSQFYVPKYEVDSIYRNEKPDLRTTIYWNPFLTTDEVGMISTKFPTADKGNDYTVTLEGISNAGEIYRFTGHIRRENK